jgi:hypothetical protein
LASFHQVKEREIEHGGDVAFLGAFFVKLEGQVHIGLKAVTLLIADPQVIHGSGAPSIGRFPEPFCCLVVVFEVIIEERTQSIHGLLISLFENQ